MKIIELFEAQSQYLYHATYSRLLPSIFKNGLGNTTNKAWDDSEVGVVYLAKSPDVAESYAETSEADWITDEDIDDIVILRIPTHLLDVDKIRPDVNVRNGTNDTVVYVGHIDVTPEMILR